ncbi:hypothetical protein ETR_13616 [Erwinia tracheiphila PSU-1]|uniref:DotU family type IV/VI secretion system protein n=1 Tax=Erwinia tracheiphila TaxID=65700 RepID=UPI000340FEEB|nr:DotU family type IV/VI secretion system protein [Erwinia tracheiphila]EOS94472.1 hypothetical protein ETR_13616 [Erwinia tracheiphila PSU-1]
MKSDIYFNRVVFIDTLLSFNGVIPSLSEFQLKLISLIDQFSKELISEGQCEQLSDELCHIICRYLDEHISLKLKVNDISWERNSLVYHFYGYDNKVISLDERIENILSKSKGEIFNYACRLLLLVKNSLGENEKITSLLLNYSPEIKTIPEREEDTPDKDVIQIPPLPVRRWSDPFIWQTGMIFFLLISLWVFCVKYLDGLY